MSHRAKRGGFALLITLTLIAFVVVLLVGLAAYTRVETAVAGNTQRQAQARQNALLALNIAVTQLQKFAGPDQRVTATGDSSGGANPHYTGVWSSDPNNASGTTPLTWLVSGSETPADLTQPPAPLVGAQTVGAGNSAGFVSAPVVSLKSYGVPGQFANDTPATGGTAIGRYAWWIGDQGVKAPVALADRSAAVNYAPWDSAELNSRIRQQIGLGAGAAVFEPRDANNAPLVASQKVSAYNQLAFLKSSADTALGLTTLQKYFDTWSPNNLAVLANTNLGGLRQDLSIDPTLLGGAFATWADYSSYIDASPSASPGLPSYTGDSVSRRYKITAPSATSAGSSGVAPVLCLCLLNFNCQTVSSAAGPQPLQIRARAIIGLWNPYTSALVPPMSPTEDLRIEISGLPAAVDFVDASTSARLATMNLRQAFGSPFTIQLPWTANNPTIANLSTQADYQSWLPGRVYYWTSAANSGGANSSIFYHKNFVGLTGSGYYVRTDPSGQTVGGSGQGQWLIRSSTQLSLRLFRGAEVTALATYASPLFLPVFQNNPVPANSGTAQFGFFFRLDQNKPDPTTETWLTSIGRDPRDVQPSSSPQNPTFIAGPNGPDPAQYGGTPSITDDSLLLERTMGSTGQSYDEDVPVFELPHSPLLSLGSLQHFPVTGQRPFAIGNSWGATAQINSLTVGSLFDSFYFSGLANGVTPPVTNGAFSLPNALLNVMPRDSAGALVAPGTLQSAPNARSSKYLLQGGAFNLNSASSSAWAAVLRSVRADKLQEYSFLDANSSSGTADDSTTDSVPRAAPNSWEPIVGDALFFRFPQSAQETYKATGQSAGGATGISPPSTELFRRGIIRLRATQVTTLAAKIADAVKAHIVATGPFRSLEEFLRPINGGSSLIEQAVIDADTAGAQINIDANGSHIEFSSQFLTQGDIMTALAPVLFPRSDTFVVRTYGEAVNPATGATEGRAWCEATVQRVPDYFDPADPAETAPAALTSTLNQTFGRRFKIVSFRWLTRSDI